MTVVNAAVRAWSDAILFGRVIGYRGDYPAALTRSLPPQNPIYAKPAGEGGP